MSLLQMAGMASAVIVLVTVLKLGPLFQELPKVRLYFSYRPYVCVGDCDRRQNAVCMYSFYIVYMS